MTGQKVKCKKATVVTKETKEQQQTGQVSMDNWTYRKKYQNID